MPTYEPNRRRPAAMGVVNCPACSAVNPSYELACDACGAALTLYIGPASNIPKRVGISSLMALVASIALGLGALRAEPIVGIFLLATLPPAVVRSMAVVSQRQVDGLRIAPTDLGAIFASSVGVVLAVAGSWAAVALMTGVVLMALLSVLTGPMVPLIVAATFATIVAGRVAWKFWPDR